MYCNLIKTSRMMLAGRLLNLQSTEDSEHSSRKEAETGQSMFATLTSKLNSKQDKKKAPCLLSGPSGSGKTSMLFEAALSFTEENGSVLFITPTFDQLPLPVQQREQPPIHYLRNIKLVYPKTRSELLSFLASVHLKYTVPFNALIIDGMNLYYEEEHNRNNEISSMGKVSAFVLDAAAYFDTMWKRLDESIACQVIASAAFENEIQFAQKKQVFSRFFPNILSIRTLPTRGSSQVFSLTTESLIKQENEHDFSLDKITVATYKIDKERIKVVPSDANI